MLVVFCTGGSPAESPEMEAFLINNFSELEREKLHAVSYTHLDVYKRQQIHQSKSVNTY